MLRPTMSFPLCCLLFLIWIPCSRRFPRLLSPWLLLPVASLITLFSTLAVHITFSVIEHFSGRTTKHRLHLLKRLTVVFCLHLLVALFGFVLHPVVGLLFLSLKIASMHWMRPSI